MNHLHYQESPKTIKLFRVEDDGSSKTVGVLKTKDFKLATLFTSSPRALELLKKIVNHKSEDMEAIAKEANKIVQTVESSGGDN